MRKGQNLKTGAFLQKVSAFLTALLMAVSMQSFASAEKAEGRLHWDNTAILNSPFYLKDSLPDNVRFDGIYLVKLTLFNEDGTLYEDTYDASCSFVSGDERLKDAVTVRKPYLVVDTRGLTEPGTAEIFWTGNLETKVDYNALLIEGGTAHMTGTITKKTGKDCPTVVVKKHGSLYVDGSLINEGDNLVLWHRGGTVKVRGDIIGKDPQKDAVAYDYGYVRLIGEVRGTIKDVGTGLLLRE